MTVRDIQAHLQEMYSVEVSAALISEVKRSRHGRTSRWRRCTQSCTFDLADHGLRFFN
jgi:transposase-like protein